MSTIKNISSFLIMLLMMAFVMSSCSKSELQAPVSDFHKCSLENEICADDIDTITDDTDDEEDADGEITDDTDDEEDADGEITDDTDDEEDEDGEISDTDVDAITKAAVKR
jgi:hypothetical protein